jgi:hypothetical protein
MVSQETCTGAFEVFVLTSAPVAPHIAVSLGLTGEVTEENRASGAVF